MNQFDQWTHGFARKSGWIIFILTYSVPIVFSIAYNAWPDFGAIAPSLLTCVIFMLPFGVAESLAFLPLVGPGSMYLTNTTGNTTNVKLPAVIASLSLAKIEPGTEKGNVIAVLATGSSALVVTAIIFLGVLLTVPLTPLLANPILTPAFAMVLPALFGTIAATLIPGQMKYWVTPAILGFFFAFCTTVPSGFYMLICLAASFVVGYFINRAEKKKKADQAPAV